MRLETSAWYALGIPLFLLLLAGERALLARRRAAPPLADALSNLGCGLGQVIVGVFTGPIVLALYDLTFARRLLDLPSTIAWPLALVGVDLCYYAFHRAGHSASALWAIHAVHHQSERFDLSVALRQPWLSDLSALLFYWPLPLLGVPALPFFAAVAALSLYQVTLHTELVGDAGACGLVFNTPSHHRVHHALGARGVGANFGATLIVWDRLFGTFVAERERVTRYGASDGHPGWSPLAAQLHAGRGLLARLRAAPSLRGKLALLFAAPAPAPAPTGEPPPPPGVVARRVAVELALVGGAAALLLDLRASLPRPIVAAVALAVLLFELRWGGLLSRDQPPASSTSVRSRMSAPSPH